MDSFPHCVRMEDLEVETAAQLMGDGDFTRGHGTTDHPQSGATEDPRIPMRELDVTLGSTPAGLLFLGAEPPSSRRRHSTFELTRVR